MIHITENKFGFTVEGHADFGTHGLDIVCAGVSVLAQSVAQVLQDNFNAHVIIHDGYLEVTCNSQHQCQHHVEQVFWCGVEELALQYPNHITIRRK